MTAPEQSEHPEVAIRRVESYAEYQACIALQKQTWGEDFADVVPHSILKVSQRIGGIVAGAFAPGGELMGFVFGITGLQEGHPVHWSDMLAVRPEFRGQGLGVRLKQFQRDELLAIGVRHVYWTYDPLVAQNAYLNIVRLGAQPVEYVEHMYGETASVLHSGLGTDRFVVEWPITSADVEAALAGGVVPDPQAIADMPVVNTDLADTGVAMPVEKDLIDRAAVLLEVPPNIQKVKTADPELGSRWRAVTRRAFQHYLANGYRVASFVKTPKGRCYYVLQRGD